MWVGLQYQVELNLSLTWFIHKTRKGIFPLASTSRVNFKFECNAFISLSFVSINCCLMILIMSSMYLSKSLASSQLLGLNFGNQMFDYGGAGWEPTTSPSIWRWGPPWVSITTLVVANSARIIKVSLSTGGMANFPEYSFSAASKIASLTGTLVYRDVTSKEITTSSWSREMFLKLSSLFSWTIYFWLRYNW